MKPRRPLRAPWLPAFVERRRRVILWVAGLATVGLGAAAPALRLDLSLDRLRPQTPQLAFEREIVRRFGLPEDLVVILSQGPDIEALLKTNQRLVEEVGRSGGGLSVFSAAQGLPTAGSQERVSAVIAQSGLSAADIGKRVTAAAEAAGFRPDTFSPFLERAPRLLDPSSRVTFEGYQQHGLGELLSPYIARTPGGFAMAAYVRPRSPADVEAVRAAVNRIGAPLQLTGMPVVNQEMSATLVPEFLIGLAIGAVAVFILMWLTFRNVRLTALALLPTLLGVVWGAGLLAILGVVVDLFSLFGVLAFIGIGVDFGIHLVHRYASEGDLAEALARIAPVNLVAAAIAILGCGTLITSSYPPLQSLGFVSVVTLVTCVTGALLVLPATLASRPSQSAQRRRRGRRAPVMRRLLVAVRQREERPFTPRPAEARDPRRQRASPRVTHRHVDRRETLSSAKRTGLVAVRRVEVANEPRRVAPRGVDHRIEFQRVHRLRRRPRGRRPGTPAPPRQAADSGPSPS